MKTTTPALALLVLAIGAATVAAPDAAANYRDTSAGGACHAASGANDKSFNYSNNYLTNIGTTNQYVICHFAMDDAGASPTPTVLFNVSTQSTQAGLRTITCSAQTGSFYSGTNHIHTNAVKAHTFDAPGDFSLEWTPSSISRALIYDTVTLNCVLGPGMRIGIIEYHD